MSAAGTGIFVSRPDVLIATSPQLLVGLSGWWLARIKRVPFVFEVRDLWPESLAAVGIGNQDSLLNRSLSAIAGFLYKRADHIAVVTPAFEDYLIRTWGVPPEKLSVVENGVQTDQFTPDVNSVDLRKQLGAEGKFVVAYIGTMGIAHGLETLLQAAAELKKTMPNVLFLMVGEGADKERIANRARSQGLTNIRFVGQQAREKVPEFICASDACVVLLKKNDLFKTVIPTKMLEFMSCARPLILGVDGQARKIMDEAKAGLFVEPENVSELVNAITRLANNSSQCETFGRNGRDHIVKRLSRQQTARVYISILEDVARVGPRHSHAMA
jgi:glycosyltransferase involved in cell wall biosynthesis